MKRREMPNWRSLPSSAKKGFHAIDEPNKGLHPRTWPAAAFAAQKRANVRQYQIRHIEEHLKGLKTEHADRENPRKPSRVGQKPEHFRHGVACALHRPVGHQNVGGSISLPYVEVRIE